MRIAITGMGVILPGGRGREALAGRLEAGTALAKPSGRLEGMLAAEVEENLKALVPRKGLAALSRSALLAAAAIENLLAETPGLLPEKNPGECALVAGTAYGHVASKAEFHEAARRDGVRLVSPIVFPNTIINSLAGHAAILYGFTGPNSTVTSGRRSGLEAVLRAATIIRAGRAERAVALGCEELSASLLRGVAAARAEGKETGAALGEAACALLLEDAGAAAAAGRRPLAVIVGAAERSAVGRGAAAAAREAIEGALERAGARAADTSWVALSRGGGEALDRAEEEAVAGVFGPGKPAAALKFIFGETFGAAGALGCAAAAIAFEKGWVPATPGGAPGTGPGGAGEPISGRSGDLGLADRPRPLPAGPALVLAVDEDGATAVVVERGAG